MYYKKTFIMKKIFLSILLISILTTNSNSQIIFQSRIGGIGDDVAWSIDTTLEHGYIVAGYTTSSGLGAEDVILCKMSNNGSVIWTKTYGGTGADICYNIKTTSDNGYIFTGNTTSSTGGGKDAFVVKVDSSGNILWQKSFGGALDEYGSYIVETPTGYLMSGMTYTYATSAKNIYLVSLKKDGTFKWAKSYGATAGGMHSGAYILPTNDNNFLICGSSMLGQTYHNSYVMKIDTNGNSLWFKEKIDSDYNANFSADNGIGGGYILAGYTTQSTNNDDIYIIKIDNNGELEWAKTWGGTQNDNGLKIINNNNNEYILYGFTGYGSGSTDLCILSLSASGNVNWSKAIGSPQEEGYSFYHNSHASMIKNFDNSITIADYTKGFGATGKDIYLIKMGLSGEGLCNETDISMNTVNISVGSSTQTPFVVNATDNYTLAFSKMDYDIKENVICSNSSIDDMENINSNLIEIFPNPTNDFLNIKFNKITDYCLLEVFSIDGKCILSKQLKNISEIINVKEFEKGMYFLRINDGKNNYSKKFIK